MKFSKNQLESKIKILPYSLEAEQSFLGGLMLDNEKWHEISNKIVEKDFFNYAHQIIVREMQNLVEQKKPIDLITLSDALEKKNLLETAGGFAYLAELSKNTPNVSNISAYADIIREKAIIREIINAASKIAEIGYYPSGKTSHELMDIAEEKIFQISKNRYKMLQGPKKITETLKNTIKKIKFLKNKKEDILGLPSGYIDLDRKILGLQNSDLIIIAARPSMGKTTFAINICENVAINSKKPVLIFSLEMQLEQIIFKILSSLSRVEQTKIRTGNLSHSDWDRLNSTVSILLEKNNIYIDDSSFLTLTEIRSKARKIFRESNGLSLIMIDYLQLMRSNAKFENRALEIAEISRSLKSLAKELNLPIIALSQLNRSLEQRSDKRPINSDLRESGSIEQDADIVIFLYRDEVYNENSKKKGIAEIILSKHRNGPIGKINLIFNGKYSRFDNYSNLGYMYK
ncbi:replicative DNA helicase [bacterium endosymbiont of Pedicinus badii]|uniref:replicative DNA helicase n=1 Tax=bacterium endosymbiont of Pedicinus badii TaxID=1719126 RepID=UPI0009BBDBFB|nr:replicative DNA helicase [bacterium endosymbiont of Pedicinus badii]OQM34135.1 replicative DNA helicase [bacterium endosymbiont of Pedicinus badii]